jgi:hypothetical protein
MKKTFCLGVLLSLAMATFANADGINDTPKEQSIRLFLNSITGTQVLQGDPACAHLSFSLINDQGNAHYEIVQIDVGQYPATYLGGTFLYSAEFNMDQACNTVTDTLLSCRIKRSSDDGVWTFNEVKTDFEITKDEKGSLTGFTLTQNRSPEMKISCHN